MVMMMLLLLLLQLLLLLLLPSSRSSFGGSEIETDVLAAALDHEAAEEVDSLLPLPSRVDADESGIDEEHRSRVEQHQDGGLKAKGSQRGNRNDGGDEKCDGGRKRLQRNADTASLQDFSDPIFQRNGGLGLGNGEIGGAEEEQVVDAESERQEGQDLRGGGVEDRAQDGAETQAGSDGKGDEEDAGSGDAHLGVETVAPPQRRDASVDENKREADSHPEYADLGEVLENVFE